MDSSENSQGVDPYLLASVARRAAAYCRMNFPSGWKPGTPAWDDGRQCWSIPVVLSRSAGAVELGQLTFDGETVRLATPRQVMVDRARPASPEV